MGPKITFLQEKKKNSPKNIFVTYSATCSNVSQTYELFQNNFN